MGYFYLFLHFVQLHFTTNRLKTFAKVDTATGEKRSYTYVLIQSFEFLDSLK